MEVNSNISLTKRAQNPAFGNNCKLPFGDVMSIMSCSHVSGIEDSVERTVTSILSGKRNPERYLDRLEARSILMQKCPDLIKNSAHFREELNALNYNHFAITIEDAANIIDREASLYGSKFVNVEI